MDNATAAILGKIIGTVVAICVGALVVQFATEKLAGFKPPYGTTCLASLLGYLASYAISFIVGLAIATNKGGAAGMVEYVTAIGFFMQAAFYSFMLKSPDGVALGYGRAFVVSFVQLTVGTFLIAFVMMMRAGAASGARG
jgi:hypothetical protein